VVCLNYLISIFLCLRINSFNIYNCLLSCSYIEFFEFFPSFVIINLVFRWEVCVVELYLLHWNKFLCICFLNFNFNVT